MKFIDTHTHLFAEEFAEDIELVIERAKEVGLAALLLPNISQKSISPMLELCAKYPNYLYPMLGLHPTEVQSDYKKILVELKKQLNHTHQFIAIGEVGLDLYWDKKYFKEQAAALQVQIEWAIEYQLPLMIHTREAHSQLINLLTPYRTENITGVFHSFGGTLEEAQELLQFDGFVLGINGIVTFKKSTLPDVLREIPLSRIVIETDSPYLAPSPQRGKRNESSYAKFIVETLAQLYETTPSSIANQTLATTLELFKRVKIK